MILPSGPMTNRNPSRTYEERWFSIVWICSLSLSLTCDNWEFTSRSIAVWDNVREPQALPSPEMEYLFFEFNRIFQIDFHFNRGNEKELIIYVRNLIEFSLEQQKKKKWNASDETVTGRKHPDGRRDSFQTKLIKVIVWREGKSKENLLEPMWFLPLRHRDFNIKRLG